ncbi:MAG: nucleoside hydrolase [Trueperaceae bacterium]
MSRAQRPAASPDAGAERAPRRVVLDVDTGTDDAVAIMLALRHPAIELVGITTVNGNAPIDVVVDNTLRVVDLAGARVSVHRGAAKPLERDDFPVARALRPDRAVHAAPLPLPPARSRPSDVPAVDFLVDTAMSSPGAISLVTTAPLTNLALALAREPRLANAFAEVLTLGGIHAIGNVTPAADFNVWADPEAARAVLRAGLRRHLLVPLDTSQRAPVTGHHCETLAASGDPLARAAARLIAARIEAYADRDDLAAQAAAPVHDAFAVAALVDRALLRTQALHVDVETHGELTTGRTVIDVDGRGGRAPNVTVGWPGDVTTFADELVRRLTAPPTGSHETRRPL